MSMTGTQVKKALYKLGFDNAYTNYTTAVKGFQMGWALGKALKVDGKAGPKTQAAILKSLARLKAGKGTMSWNFSFAEFRCKCGTDGYRRQPGCKRMFTRRVHVLRLEKYRKRTGRVVRIISGYRCPGHNAAVGGAKFSQHQYGYSSDFVGVVKADTVVGWKIFAGVGQGGHTGFAVHGDSRDRSPNNTTNSSTGNPSRWTYPWG